MATSIFRKLENGVIKFTSGMNAVATFWIFVIMFLMTGDVLGRVLFNHPITGTPEIVKVSIVGIVFLQIPHTLWINRHIRSDVIIARLKPNTQQIIHILVYLLGVAVFVGIFYSSWGDTITAWQKHEIEGEGALRVPVYPIRTIILLGSATTVMHFIIKIRESVEALKSIRRGNE